jgi:di/tricarboxylate transporter
MYPFATLVLLILLLVVLVNGRVRPDLVFGGTLVSLVVLGILSPKEAFSGFSNPVVFTIASFFLVAHGLQLTRSLDTVSMRLFKDGIPVKTMMGRMMSLTVTVSSFVNNTPVVAMMMVPVTRWSTKNRVPASKLLMPLSHLTILGGLITLVGTSTSLIVSGLLVSSGNEPLRFWELTPVAIPACLLAMLYYLTVGYAGLPGHGRDSFQGHASETADAEQYHFNLKVPRGSAMDGLTIEKAGLRSLRHAYLAYVIRNGTNTGMAAPDFVLKGDDTLCFVGSYPGIQELAKGKGLLKEDWKGKDSSQKTYIYEAVVSPNSSLVGNTLKESGFREKFMGVVLAIRRRDGIIQEEIGRTPIKQGDLLLVEALDGFERQWNSDIDDFYLVTRKNTGPTLPTYKAGTAQAIVIALLAACITGLLELHVAAMSAAICMVATGCVPVSEVYRASNIPVLIVVACSIGIGRAMESSGFSDACAGMIVTHLSGAGYMSVAAALYLLTNAVTEVLPNQSTAVLMMPIAIALSNSTGMDTHAFAVPVAIAASCSFLTPTGYQTNLMVMSPGGYRAGDYARVGWPLTLSVFLITMTYVWLVHAR